MKKKYQNGFFIFGVLIFCIMLTQLDFSATMKALLHAGYWFWAVVMLLGIPLHLQYGSLVYHNKQPKGWQHQARQDFIRLAL